jgi:hypothetical protein
MLFLAGNRVVGFREEAMNRARDRSRTIFAGAIPLAFHLVVRLRFTFNAGGV